jgi:L-fuculose-phosphate aldolase
VLAENDDKEKLMTDFDFEKFGRDFLAGVTDAAGSVADAARSVGDDAGRYKVFLQTGHYLDNHDLVSSHGGNLSVCDGQTLWITRTGAMLGTLVPGEIIACPLAEGTTDARASRELPVHRALYRAAFARAETGQTTAEAGSAAAASGEVNGAAGTSGEFSSAVAGTSNEFSSAADAAKAARRVLAIVHAHPLVATALSLAATEIKPLDSEGRLLLGAALPVFAAEETVASAEVAVLLASALTSASVASSYCALVRGHGSFALARSLEEALQLTVALERSARIIALSQGGGGGV